MNELFWAQPIVFVFLSPLMLGVINKTKAFVAGRQGPPVLQLYWDLWKLLRKGMVLSRTTTWVFLAGPVVGWCAVFAACWMVPLGRHPAPVAFEGDMVLVTYLLALGRFLTVAAGLDTGSSFEGMGTSREVTFASFSEPALFLGFMALAKATGSLSLTGMFELPKVGVHNPMTVSLLLLAIGWFIVMLAENCRIPFDDPNTHLELTMVHEVMVLDHSGPAFALILHAASMKLLLLGTLFLNVLFTWSSPDPWKDAAYLAVALFLLAVVIGWVESVMARLRLRHIPNLLVTASLLAAFSLILLSR
jgi:formate hydrogenlyase subunit 4